MGEFGFKDISAGLKKEYYTNDKKPEVAKEVLFDRGISVEGENITPIDLFTIPAGLSGQEKIQIISKNLQIEAVDLERKLPEISQYWREAKEFYAKSLVPTEKNGLAFPREIERLDGFNNLQELKKYLDKATLSKKGDNLGFGPFYCALFSLMIAEREYDKAEFEGLLNESKYISRELSREDKDGVVRFHTAKIEDDELSHVGIMTGEDQWTNTRFGFRGKTKESAVTKLAKKPDFSVEERMRDGIGLKFEVATEKDAERLLLFLSHTLVDKFGAERVVFENVNLFDRADKQDDNSIEAKLKEAGVWPVPPEENKSSHKNFKVAKIIGKLKVPKNGEDGSMIMTRNFEVQIVLTNNKNETGLAQNKIYKRVQKLSLFTRLFGSFNEGYLDMICQEASEASNMPEEEIKKYIIENFLLRVRTKSKNIKYISRDQFRRWERAGMIPAGITTDSH